MPPTPEERLGLVLLRMQRAEEHVRNLSALIEAFNKTKPYEVTTKRDPQTRKLIYYVSSIKPMPVGIALLTGDIIQNLRSALDYLAYQLFLASGGSGSGEHVYFLIERNASEYRARLPAKVKGMRQPAIDALSALEPYRGGKGEDFWKLHMLNNIDKHRLFVTVGAYFRNIDLWPIMKHHMPAGMFSPDINMSLPMKPADILCPLKVGDELFIDGPDTEENQNVRFAIDIAIKEPGIMPDGEPLMESLNHFGKLVSDTAHAFKPLLA